MRLSTLLFATPAIIGSLAGSLAMAAPVAQQADNSVGRAATQPLRDTRIKQDKIPQILLLAASAPYSSVNTRSCAAIAREVRLLTNALGPDVDGPATTKGEGSAIAAAAARAAVNTLIPGLGLVRVITGADKAQRRAEAAVYAGSVRRGYLKGLGLAKRCGPPAAPTSAAINDRPELPVDNDKGLIPVSPARLGFLLAEWFSRGRGSPGSQAQHVAALDPCFRMGTAPVQPN